MTSIYEVAGEDTVRNMDRLVFRFLNHAEDEKMRDFEAGRNAAAYIFTELGVKMPDDLFEAGEVVRDYTIGSSFALDEISPTTPEFAFGSVFAAFVIKKRQELQA